MNRWITSLLTTLALAASAAAFSQTLVREAPADVKPGRLAISTPPVATLNGQPDRLSPGARIRDTNNMLMLSGNLSGQSVPVVYRRDSAGLMHEVWLLTEAEYAKLGGDSAGADPAAVKEFNALLATIFGTRR